MLNSEKYFVTIVHVADQGLQLDLLSYIEQESLCIKQVIIPGSREIKMGDRGISTVQLETIVFLVSEIRILRLREILDELDLLGRETTFSYDACSEKVLKMLGLGEDWKGALHW
jgi:hypothetical protein